MLQELIDLLKKHNLYILDSIKNIAEQDAVDGQTFVSSDKVVVDYDALKKAYCNQAKFIGSQPKSADALLIENNAIIFLEVKSILPFLNQLKGLSVSEARTQLEFIFQTKFNASKKIIDSIFLLLDIARNFQINPTFFSFFISDDCNKKFYFLVECSTRDFVRWGWSIKPLQLKYEYFKLGQVRFIPSSIFHQEIS